MFVNVKRKDNKKKYHFKSKEAKRKLEIPDLFTDLKEIDLFKTIKKPKQ